MRPVLPHSDLIITYQEKLGNYNGGSTGLFGVQIITYQEKLGNYNMFGVIASARLIITYQEKLGNYNPIPRSA